MHPDELPRPTRAGFFFISHQGGGASLATIKMGETGFLFEKKTRFLNPGTLPLGGERERQTLGNHFKSLHL
jgi:hypothetical protein